mmetsp:Transcript_19467/g.41948  ORF Transcript_19467/g.41948 Transcript_19467/m.41948 type:complete len:222 (+) Transcript_19467:2411-3076(+)
MQSSLFHGLTLYLGDAHCISSLFLDEEKPQFHDPATNTCRPVLGFLFFPIGSRLFMGSSQCRHFPCFKIGNTQPLLEHTLQFLFTHERSFGNLVFSTTVAAVVIVHQRAIFFAHSCRLLQEHFHNCHGLSRRVRKIAKKMTIARFDPVQLILCFHICGMDIGDILVTSVHFCQQSLPSFHIFVRLLQNTVQGISKTRRGWTGVMLWIRRRHNDLIQEQRQP